jgi:hypothetical protein
MLFSRKNNIVAASEAMFKNGRFKEYLAKNRYFYENIFRSSNNETFA